METIFNPYREWLGWEKSRGPDYYELLAIARHETDVARIVLAAEQAMRKVRSFRPGPQAQVWSRLLDEIRAARDCLSNPALRAEYDAALARTDRLRSSAGDLHSPTVPASLPPLAGAGGAAPIFDARRRVVSVPTPSPRADDEAESYDCTPLPGAIDELLPPGEPLAESPDAAVAVLTAPTARRFSALRQRSAWQGLVIAVIGSIAVGIFGAAVLLWRVPGADSERVSNVEDSATPAIASDESTARVVVDQRATAVPAEAAAEPPSSSGPPSLPVAAANPLPTAAELPEEKRARLQALVQALETAKTALGEQNFSVADEQLERASGLAKSDSQHGAVDRLTEIAGYAKQFYEALAVAAQALQAGDTIRISGGSEVAFVEGFESKVTLHVSGRNNTYAYSELPPALALAIADRRLPAKSPASAVVKGAYLAVHKQDDTRTRERAAELWNEAEAGGAKTAHLSAFFDDNYSNFLSDPSS